MNPAERAPVGRTSLGVTRLGLGGAPLGGLFESVEHEGALAGAQVFALPCTVAPDGDRDGIPVSLIEAMAAGLPVITSPVAGIGELVDEEVGWLVPPGDERALRGALRDANA